MRVRHSVLHTGWRQRLSAEVDNTCDDRRAMNNFFCIQTGIKFARYS